MTRSARAVASPRVVNIEDLRQLARRRLPRVVFDYLDGGAEGEVTLRENRRAFDTVTFRPRHAVRDRKSTRLNSSHVEISYAVFCLKKKNKEFPIFELVIPNKCK